MKMAMMEAMQVQDVGLCFHHKRFFLVLAAKVFSFMENGKFSWVFNCL